MQPRTLWIPVFALAFAALVTLFPASGALAMEPSTAAPAFADLRLPISSLVADEYGESGDAEADEMAVPPESAPASGLTKKEEAELDKEMERAVGLRRVGLGMTWGGFGGAIGGGVFALLAWRVEVPELMWSGIGLALVGAAFVVAGIPVWIVAADRMSRIEWKRKGLITLAPYLAPTAGGGVVGVAGRF